MSNQELPDWDWVKGLEVDYLPREVQELVKEVGVLIYIYARSVDEGNSLWKEVRISAIENRVTNLEVLFRKHRSSESTTLAELLTTLVLAAALSTGLGLVVTAVASGTAALARSALTWHKAAKKFIPRDQVYADVRTQIKLIKELESEVARSKRILEMKTLFKFLDKNLEIGKNAKKVSVSVLSAIVKGEVTLLEDIDRKPSKHVDSAVPINKLINEHWNGLFASVRAAKQDLDNLLEYYKFLHEVGLLDDEWKDDERLKDLRKPLHPKLFQSAKQLLPKNTPKLAALLLLNHDGNLITGERSNHLSETLRDFAREQFAHILVFQLSALIFTPEIIGSSVDILKYKSLKDLSIDTREKGLGIPLSYDEYHSPYRAEKSRLVDVKVVWKSNEFKSYMAALLNWLNEPDEFNRTYLSHAQSVVSVGKERTVQRWVPIVDMGYVIEHVRLKPPTKEDADLEYAFLLYYYSLFQNMTFIWPKDLATLKSEDSAMLRKLIPFQ